MSPLVTLGFGVPGASLATLGFGALAVSGPTTATLSGPATGVQGVPSASFTIALDQPASAGGVTCTVTSSAGDTITANPVVIAAGANSGTFTVTPGSPGARLISLVATSPSLAIAGSPLTLTAAGAAPTAAALAGPATATNGFSTDPFTVTLDRPATVPVTCTLTSSVGGDTIAVTPFVIPIGASVGSFRVTPHTTGARALTLATAPALSLGGSPATLTVSDPLPPEVFTTKPIVVLPPAARWRPGGWR